MFKVKSRNTKTWCLYCLLLTYFTPCCDVSIVNFKQVNVGKDGMEFKNESDINREFGKIVTIFII